VHVRESVGVTKGEVKAKSGAFHRKGYDYSSLAGGGALPARPCRNVDEAERQRTRWYPKDRDTISPRQAVSRVSVSVSTLS